MPNQKISELTELAAGNVANDDEVAIVDTSTTSTKRWTWASIKSDILSWLGFTATEASYLSGVTSAIQTQIDGKADSSHTHTLTDITDSGALAALDTVGTAEIDNDAVTFDKIANIATNRVLARSSAGSGSVEALTLPNFRTLINVEDGATADQTGAEIKSLYEAEADTNAFTDADHSKLDGIEAGADVTDETNVVSALSGATLSDAGAPQATDKVLVQDASDSDNLKYVDFSDFSSGTTVDVVSNVAADRILGRVTAGSGDSEELTATQVRTLINVEDGATADQTGAEIKAAYEGEADTNAFTDAEKTKLSGIATGAEVNTVDSVNTQTGAVVLDADDIDDTLTTNKFATSAELSKLAGIETGADVTDTANVTAAGALMDSELTDLAGVKALDTSTLATLTGSQTLTNKTIDFDNNDIDSFPVSIGIAVSDETTDLTTGTAKATFRMPYAMTLTEVRANVNTAPVGATIQVDINESGTTILSTVISIDASEKTSETAATAPVISDSALADDAEITIDIDQVGSSTAGKGLKIWLIGVRDNL